jgi:hypothetical protein
MLKILFISSMKEPSRWHSQFKRNSKEQAQNKNIEMNMKIEAK